MIIERPEDMSQRGKLRLLIQRDGDVIIAVQDDSGHMLDIEFCTPGTGGGRSPETWKALHILANAMRADNGDLSDQAEVKHDKS